MAEGVASIKCVKPVSTDCLPDADVSGGTQSRVCVCLFLCVPVWVFALWGCFLLPPQATQTWPLTQPSSDAIISEVSLLERRGRRRKKNKKGPAKAVFFSSLEESSGKSFLGNLRLFSLFVEKNGRL